jgi:hypothetical protein
LIEAIIFIGIQATGKSTLFQQRFFNTSALKAALERNRQRRGKALIPEKGIIGAYRKLELPSFDEGFDQLFYVEIAEGGQFIVMEWSDEV